MHREALTFLRSVAAAHPTEAAGRVLEIGSRVFYDQDKAGLSVRSLFPGAALYYGIDAVAGPGVDLVCPSAGRWVDEWQAIKGAPFDFVVCAEVLEHDPDWPATVRACVEALRPGGVFALTWATPARAPHCVDDGSPVRGYYAGVPLSDVPPLLVRAGGVVLSAHTERRGEDAQVQGYRA